MHHVIVCAALAWAGVASAEMRKTMHVVQAYRPRKRAARKEYHE